MSEQEKQVFLASGKLISLTDAAKLTPYSSDYLSLLARKQRIPAVKISRDWLTTREAVVSYVSEQQKKHQQLIERFESLEGETV